MNVHEIMRRVSRLKSCPFCGAAAWAGKHPHHPGKFIIRCSSDGDTCPYFPSTGPFLMDKMLEYLNAWNNRSE